MFLEMGNDEQNACLELLPQIALAETKSETQHLLDKFKGRTSRPLVEIAHALGVLNFFIDGMADRETAGDTTSAWSKDLAEKGILRNQAEEQRFVSMMDRIREEVFPEFDKKRRRRGYATGVLPSLTDLGITVELRAVQKEKYRWGTPEEDYKPKIVDLVGVASIHIGVDAGPQNHFYFQMSEHEIDAVIASFVAARRDLAALRDSVSFKGNDLEKC